jgi:hypothetical protein
MTSLKHLSINLFFIGYSELFSLPIFCTLKSNMMGSDRRFRNPSMEKLRLISLDNKSDQSDYRDKVSFKIRD